MIRKEFSLNGVPFMLAGYNCHIMLETGGIIDVMTDDENIASRLKADVLLSVQSHLLPYSGKTSLEELPDMAINVEQEVTEELTRTTGTDFIMKFDYFLPDDRSRKIIDDIDKMKKFSDPAFAAAELERAMKQAQETAKKNGIDPSTLQNMKMPDLPPLPETDDPLARAKAITAQFEQMKQTAMNGSLAVPPAAAAGVVPALQDLPSQPRPKFCANCGARLPESGNFCPNCGNKI